MALQRTGRAACLDLSQIKLALTHDVFLYPFGMPSGFVIPVSHRALVQSEGKHDRLQGATTRQQGQHRRVEIVVWQRLAMKMWDSPERMLAGS